MKRMHLGQPLLLPVSPVWVGASLAGAFALGMVQSMGFWGRVPWMPDLVAVVLLFWSIYQPRRVGMGIAFLLGLLIDVHQGSPMGLHALAYTVLGFFALSLNRRLLWFSLPWQAFQVLPLFALAHAIELLLRMAVGGAAFPGFWLLLAPLLEAIIWPLVAMVLLAPQRWAPHPDENSPL